MEFEGRKRNSASLGVVEAVRKVTAATQATVVQRRQWSESQRTLPVVPSPPTLDLSVVVPTRNERDNIRPLLHALYGALHDLYAEIIFVDDSDDDTPEIIEDIAITMGSPRFQVKLKHRSAGRERAGGLATAVIHGIAQAHATYVAVIDADLQHPPAQLRVLYDHAVARSVDLAIASRYIKGGSYEGLDGAGRLLFSVGLKWTAKLLFPGHLLRISDPLGGFFLMRRSLLADVSLRPIGYKILLEVLLRCPWRRVIEVPYRFQVRAHGQSKANMRQGLMALQHMLRLWREVPAAGRIWKISLLLLINAVVAFALLYTTAPFSWIWTRFGMAIFGVMACLDFTLFTRFLFPSPVSAGHTMPPEPSLSLPRNAPSPARSRTSSMITARHGARSARKATLYRYVLATIAAAMTILAISRIGQTLSGMLLALAVLFIGAAIVFTERVKLHQAITMVLAIAVGVASIDYLSWRFVVTNWQGWWIAGPLLFAEALGAIHTIGFQCTVWPWSPPKSELREDPTAHPIFVFVPTVNEGADILRPTLKGIIAARKAYLERYPRGRVTIVVCNDGLVARTMNWAETETLCKEMGVSCVTRTKGGGAKAGNIEHARRAVGATNDALLVIFDADQVARPNFLLKTIPYFSDPKIGWVQTGQYYANLDNPVSRWADDQQSMFYNLLCPGKAALNAAFICGTNVVIRAATLDEIGGLPQDSVTEDFAASIALHPSWRSIYLTDVLATGLGPLDVPSYLKQQRRWAIGTLGVLRSHWRDIFLPRKHGLRIGQRVQYFLACTHYLSGLRDLIYLISPILFIFTGIPAVHNSLLSDFIWHFVPYSLLSWIAMWYTSRSITGLRGITVGFGSFPVLIESLLSVVLGRKVGFSVTAKQRAGKRSLGYMGVYVFFFLLCIASLLWATQVKAQQQTSLFISMLWIVYSLLMLGSFLWLIVKDLRFQVAVQQRIATDGSAAKQAYPAKLSQRKYGLGPVWSLGLAALVASPILVNSQLTFLVKSQSTPFVISQTKSAAPYFGLSLPVQLLASQPPVLERDLNTLPAIIGRTQNVQDTFDRSWADQLAAQHVHPWITLEFGNLGPNQTAPLDASLPAIIHGLHDQDLRRWAEDIGNYDKPVYLTILLHADRNWSVSSGVANGGIPSDVSKAWLHVQSVFRSVGTNNVAWIWAPADPIHDQAFAPPPSAIDAVLQSFIEYPGTSWSDPETVLHHLELRYPTKPIIVETAVDGPAAQKSSWLTKLGRAVNYGPHIYALVYHEGGPALNATRAQMESWSLASDPTSLATFRRIVISLHNDTKAHS